MPQLTLQATKPSSWAVDELWLSARDGRGVRLPRQPRRSPRSDARPRSRSPCSCAGRARYPRSRGRWRRAAALRGPASPTPPCPCSLTTSPQGTGSHERSLASGVHRNAATKLVLMPALRTSPQVSVSAPTNWPWRVDPVRCRAIPGMRGRITRIGDVDLTRGCCGWACTAEQAPSESWLNACSAVVSLGATRR